MKKSFKVILLVLIFAFFKIFVAMGQPTEYMYKAGLLSKFVMFTSWPAECEMGNTNKPFIIKVIGKSPFDGALEKVYKNAKLSNKSIKIEYISKISEISNSHLLFICASENKKLKDIIDATSSKPILLVADSEGFAQKGVHINIYIRQDGTLHFEINPDAVKRSLLRVEATLLDYAKIVK